MLSAAEERGLCAITPLSMGLPVRGTQQLGDAGGLGCTLLIEIDDVARRDELLRAWLALPQHIYLELEDGERVRPSFDPRQGGDTRLSAVQYFKFDCGGCPPRGLGCDLPGLELHHVLTAEQSGALQEEHAKD